MGLAVVSSSKVTSTTSNVQEGAEVVAGIQVYVEPHP